jgi:hypothetical protein
MGNQPPAPDDAGPAAAGEGPPPPRTRRPWIVRIARPIVCKGTWEECPYRSGVRSLLRQPAVFPPLVLLSAVFAQRFADHALGDSGTARPWHAYVVFAVVVPVVLLAIGWLSCMVLEHVNRHIVPDQPREDPPGWATSLGVTVVIDGLFILTAVAAVVLALRPFADTWPLISHAYNWLDETPSTGAQLFQAALWLWIGALLVSVVRGVWRFLRPRHPWRARFAMAGALFNSAALGFIVLSVLAYYAAADSDPTEGWSRGVATAVPGSVFGDPQALADRYSPRLAFDREEPWRPISIESVEQTEPPFVVRDTSATARRLEAPSPLSSLDTSGLSCRGPAPCYQVDLTAFADENCSTGDVPAGLPGCSGTPTAFARVVTPGSDPNAFPSEPLPGDSFAAVIEYWFFYGYDRWEQQTPVGLFSQHHDGDWEGAFVAFSPDRVPMWVAYTAHCGGVVKLWKDVRVDGTHPYVFVAKGSHANYPTEAPQTPDWLGCAGRAKHSGSDVAFLDSLANIREQVRPDDNGVIPTVLRVDSQPLVTAPLWWGTVDKSVLSPPVLSPDTLASGTGPESPGCKPLWREPIATIYCDHRWDASDVVPDDRDAFCSRWKTGGLDCAAA